MTRGGDDVQGPETPQGTPGWPHEGGTGSRAAGRHGRGARRRPYASDEPGEPRSQADPLVEAPRGADDPHTPQGRRRWSRQKGYTGYAGRRGAGASGEPYEDEGADDEGAGDEAVLTAPAPAPESAYQDVEQERERPRRGRAGGLTVALLALVAAGLAVAVTLAYLDLRTLRRNEADGAAALAAARSYAPDMLAYDHRQIEQDLARAQGHATARLAGYYRQLAATLIPEARREQTVQQVTIAGAAVESATPDRVRVLMLVNRTTSRLPPGHGSRKGEVSQGRVRFVMVKGGDGVWLVDELSTLLGNPPART